MEGQIQMVLMAAGIVAVVGLIVAFVIYRRRTAYLGPVKEELQKEKAWLRRGEYNAAMVKGRQNLELLLKLVAEKNGIQLDNTAQAVANAKEQGGRQNQNGRPGQNGNRNGDRRHGNKTTSVMTHHQFNRWLNENGYLDRVARWEMNQVRLIGNKAVHENYAEKEDAWNQYNYLEDILKIITEMSQSKAKRQERIKAAEEERKKHNQGQGRKKAKNGKSQGKKNERNGQGQENKEKSAKTVKVKNSQAAAQKVELSAVQQPGVEDSVNTEEQTRKKRRRRKKKTQSVQQAQAETKAAVIEKEAAPTEAKSGDQQKKRRRHRRRKPAGASKDVANVADAAANETAAAAEKTALKASAPTAAVKPSAPSTAKNTETAAKPKKKSGNYWRKRRNHKKTSGQQNETCPGGQE